MSSLFRSPKIPEQPKPEPTPAPPTVDQATVDQQAADAELRRRRRGRAAYMLGGSSGYGSPQSAARTLGGE